MANHDRRHNSLPRKETFTTTTTTSRLPKETKAKSHYINSHFNDSRSNCRQAAAMGLTKKSGSAKETAQSVKVKGKHGSSPSAVAVSKETKKGGGGLDEIDSLFADKKKQQKDTAEKSKKQQAEARQRRKAANHKPAPPTSSLKKGEWVDDGLGGKYNAEGYTGRVEDGVKVFKTHLLQSSNSGSTAECPFDCNCCFI